MKRLLAIFVVWRNDTILVENMAKLTDKDDNALTDSNDILQEVNSVFLMKSCTREEMWKIVRFVGHDNFV